MTLGRRKEEVTQCNERSKGGLAEWWGSGVQLVSVREGSQGRGRVDERRAQSYPVPSPSGGGGGDGGGVKYIVYFVKLYEKESEIW